jgi:Cdk activating kinase (CAK)/RNA polymerase II transcription initiation/nucleotide excision repair factor TFIIH/TFIIK, cyclin H subunit
MTSITPPLTSGSIVTQVTKPFFTSLELSHLHSLTIPESKKLAYNKRKHQIFHYLFQIVRTMKFPLKVLNTAMNYYQRYYLFNVFSEEDDPASGSDGGAAAGTGSLSSTASGSSTTGSANGCNDPITVALTALFLATKNEDCIKKLRDIQTVALKIRDEDEASEKKRDPASINGLLDTQRRAIMNVEFKLLQTIKFDFINGNSLAIESLDKLVIQFAKKLGISYKISMFAWLVSFDLISTPLLLMLPQHCIALAIIIITLNLKPSEVKSSYGEGEDNNSEKFSERSEKSSEKSSEGSNTTDNSSEKTLNSTISGLTAILESIDCTEFRCPEPLVNEAIIYILDYYIHQMSYSILNEYIPPVDSATGKEQIFKFMDLKSRFNDLKNLNQYKARYSLKQDQYLRVWDYSVAAKGSARFILGNKRRRFVKELEVVRPNLV